MKTSIILLSALFALVACQKEAKLSPTIVPAKAPLVAVSAVNNDTIPDKAVFKIKLFKDSINSDETMLMFSKKAKLSYDDNEDADYFPGYGQESLASLSSDGRNLAINRLPYTPGMYVGLDVETKSDGDFSFKLSYENNMPKYIQIWVKDTYLKDSANVCISNYNFSVKLADANTFGNKRFKLIIKDNIQTIGSITK